MNIDGSIAFVTGANRGLGAAFTQALLERGAAKVYAAVRRRPDTITDPRVVPVRLDPTLSVLSWVTLPTTAGYSAAKSALWSATNALRLTLAEQNTLVVAVHVGYMDTDMAAAITTPKANPRAVADATLNAIQAGDHEVLADDLSRKVRAGLSGPLGGLYPSLIAPTAA